MRRVLLIIGLALMAVSCGGLEKKAKAFEKILEAQTGQDQSVAKLYTKHGNYVVYKNEVTGEFSAYNLDKYNKKKMKSLDAYMAAVTVGTDVVYDLELSTEWVESGYWTPEYEDQTVSRSEWDSECECYETVYYTERVYVGPSRWVDTSRYVDFYIGGGFKFDNASTQSRDLETLAALKEEAAEKYASYKLSSEFSLSTGRADELAKLAMRYQKMESSRELTLNEKNSFALEALGVSMSQVEASLKKKAEGDEDEFKQLLDKAAVHNRTTPEQIGRFFNEYISEGFEE